MRSIKKIGQKVIVRHKQVASGSRDEDDNKFLECGIVGKADCIISGDVHLLELKRYGDIRIITVKEYLEIVG